MEPGCVSVCSYYAVPTSSTACCLGSLRILTGMPFPAICTGDSIITLRGPLQYSATALTMLTHRSLPAAGAALWLKPLLKCWTVLQTQPPPTAC